MLDLRVLFDQQLDQGMEQGFSSLANIMDELKESDVKK